MKPTEEKLNGNAICSGCTSVQKKIIIKLINFSEKVEIKQKINNKFSQKMPNNNKSRYINKNPTLCFQVYTHTQSMNRRQHKKRKKIEEKKLTLRRVYQSIEIEI